MEYAFLISPIHAKYPTHLRNRVRFSAACIGHKQQNEYVRETNNVEVNNRTGGTKHKWFDHIHYEKDVTNIKVRERYLEIPLKASSKALEPEQNILSTTDECSGLASNAQPDR
jgi:hypothetical protein